MITSIILWLQTKRRLLTEYALLACFVSLGGLAFSLWVSRMELQTDLKQTREDLQGVQLRLSLSEAAVDMHEDTLNRLSLLRQLDTKSIEELYLKFGTISSNRAKLETTIRNLEKTDNDVQKYLDTDVPPILGCVLEPSTCTQASGTDKN